jgi:uncharacterized protein with HEPN domain
MKRDDNAYIRHILDAITQIEEYLSGKSLEEFMASKMVHDAVIRQLEIIGEATKNLSTAAKAASPEIPWRDIAGMRDILIHQYFGVDLLAVWKSASEELTLIKRQLLQVKVK